MTQIATLDQFVCKECGQPLSDHFGDDNSYSGCPDIAAVDIQHAFKTLKSLSKEPTSPTRSKVRNPRVSYKLAGKIAPKLFNSLNATQQKIITRLRDKKTTTTRDLESTLKIRQTILGSELQKLRSRGIIESTVISTV